MGVSGLPAESFDEAKFPETSSFAYTPFPLASKRNSSLSKPNPPTVVAENVPPPSICIWYISWASPFAGLNVPTISVRSPTPLVVTWAVPGRLPVSPSSVNVAA